MGHKHLVQTVEFSVNNTGIGKKRLSQKVGKDTFVLRKASE